MDLLKKGFFALPFILFLCGFLLQFSGFLQDPNFVLSLDTKILVQTIILSALIVLSGLSFIVFVTLTSDLKYILPVIFIAAISPILLLPAPLSFIVAGELLLSLFAVSFLLLQKLKSYLTFQASNLLSPQTKQLITLLVIISSVGFYLAADQFITQKGFTLPDSLIDMSLQFIPKDQLAVGSTENNLPALSPEQIALLEKNPQALKQFGLDPKVLETIKTQSQSQSQLSPQELIKPMIRSQIDNFIAPYQKYIPIFLAVILFFTLQTFSSLLSIFLSPLLSLIFLILEKTGFTHYEVETREVKKLVV